jgi:hypothetical protein
MRLTSSEPLFVICCLCLGATNIWIGLTLVDSCERLENHIPEYDTAV